MTRRKAPLRLGTRGSPLALWQANHVLDLLRPKLRKRATEQVIIETTGDVVRDVPLSQAGGIGLFTKEIQNALLDNRCDVAIHSLKDLPTIPVEGLYLASVPLRGPTGDAFVSTRHARFDDLPQGATIATSSLRRRAQALHRRPDLKLVDIRGNVETRLRKLEEQGLDGLILAQAGLERLGLAARITEILDPSWMLPAVGQGALGLECRKKDRDIVKLLEKVDHWDTHQAVLAERSMLWHLGGGCLVPVGVLSAATEEVLTMRAVVLDPNGQQMVEAQVIGPPLHPVEVGKKLADRLLAAGADELLGSRPMHI